MTRKDQPTTSQSTASENQLTPSIYMVGGKSVSPDPNTAPPAAPRSWGRQFSHMIFSPLVLLGVGLLLIIPALGHFAFFAGEVASMDAQRGERLTSEILDRLMELGSQAARRDQREREELQTLLAQLAEVNEALKKQPNMVSVSGNPTASKQIEALEKALRETSLQLSQRNAEASLLRASPAVKIGTLACNYALKANDSGDALGAFLKMRPRELHDTCFPKMAGGVTP